MSRHAISLNDDEQALLAKIDLRDTHSSHDESRAAWENNRQSVPALMKSLHDRNAIPAERMHYWNDPKYQTGRMKGSNEDLFHRNGCAGPQIYEHVSFLKYLRYFIYGADLSEDLIEEFQREAIKPEHVTSGDLIPMGDLARRLTRKHGLEKHHAAEEIFKLALDLDYGLSTSDYIRRAVK